MAMDNQKYTQIKYFFKYILKYTFLSILHKLYPFIYTPTLFYIGSILMTYLVNQETKIQGKFISSSCYIQ